jgi:protein O-GlcNAc transferase
MLLKLRDLLKPKKTPSEGRSPGLPAAQTAAEMVPLVQPAAQARGSSGSVSGAASPERGVISPEDLFKQAQGLQQQGELERAVELYGLAIEGAPDRAEVYYKRANALNGLGRLEAAVADYDRAISLNPGYAYALCNRGSVLERLGRREEALGSYDRAIALDAKDALTHYNRGSVLKDLGRFEEALTSYEAAIGLNGDFAEAHVNRGNVLQELRRHAAAAESFGRAIALKPAIAEAFQGRGLALHMLRRLGPALTDCNQAITLKPDLAGLYRNRGNLLCDLQRHDAAAADYLKAVELDPADAQNYSNLGSAFVNRKQLDRAIASFDKAMALDPDMRGLLGERRGIKMQMSIWEGLDDDLDLIARGVADGKPVCNPMTLAALADSPALLRSAAKIWLREPVLGTRAPVDDGRGQEEGLGGLPTSARRPDRIRVGYFSSDFRAHPVGYLTAGLFEHHDRSRFETTGFAFGPEANDAMAVRLSHAFDRFIDVRRKSDLEVAELARELEIDIAVDLNGITDYRRTKIFALRAAPIQVNFLGCPCTMGAEFMDYLIADGTVIPRAQQAHYTERIVYLPQSFMPFDSSYAIAERRFSREELGLPAEGMVFCSFNNSYKILPQVFDRWMRILGRVEGSVLWLQRANEWVSANLRREASQRGIDERRVIFAERTASLPEHVARLRAADLFLDTFPYNAHATALDTLWAGVPLLTYAGESFASRVAASLLRTVDLGELITGSLEEYEELAVELAGDGARLERLRGKLAERGAPLFDTGRYTRDLEAAYEALYERHQAGLAPAHINEQLAL